MKECMYEIKEDLCNMLEEMSKGGNVTRSELQDIQMLTSSIKNICKIEALEMGEGYSYGNATSYDSSTGNWRANGSYGRGYSEADRGQHYVRGHYSYADGRMMPEMRRR